MAVNIEFGNISSFDCKGNPTSVGPRWRRWKRSFEFLIEAKGITNDSQKKALLLHCAGQDVQDVFDTLTDPGPVPERDSEYAKAMRSLDAHFSHQVNIPFERHQFRQAKQEESETADQFVLRLFQLSENCEFGEAKEEHPRSIDRQMQVAQSSQEITGSEWKTYTSKSARDCKINGSG